MFHGLEAEELEDSDAVVPAPVGPPSLGPFRRLNLELGCTYAATHDRLGLKVTVQVVRVRACVRACAPHTIFPL